MQQKKYTNADDSRNGAVTLDVSNREFWPGCLTGQSASATSSNESSGRSLDRELPVAGQYKISCGLTLNNNGDGYGDFGEVNPRLLLMHHRRPWQRGQS